MVTKITAATIHQEPQQMSKNTPKKLNQISIRNALETARKQKENAKLFFQVSFRDVSKMIPKERARKSTF